jgi:hypothetical protein
MWRAHCDISRRQLDDRFFSDEQHSSGAAGGKLTDDLKIPYELVALREPIG